MKKLVLVTLFIAAFSIFSQTAIQPAGSGTQLDPYRIATWENLYWIRQNSASWDKQIIQIEDINFGTAVPDIQTWQSGIGWSPHIVFSGTYDGQGYKIEGLYTNLPDSYTVYGAGLFKSTSGAVIKNLNLINFEIFIFRGAGLLAGSITNTTVTNCSFQGRIYSAYNAGGLTGSCSSSQINNCYSSIQFEPYYYLGSLNYPIVSGGLVGEAKSGTVINNCYSTGSIMSSGYNGGLVSELDNSSVTNCYSSVYISDDNANGGLIATSAASTVSNSFWSNMFSGQRTSAGGTHATEAQMQDIDFYRAAGWDFIFFSDDGTDDYWRIVSNFNNGLPILSWQNLTSWSPFVNDSWAYDITETTANFNAQLLDLGNPALTQHGIEWSKWPGLAMNVSRTSLGSADSTGIYHDTLTGLSPNMVYYFRSYAQNSTGTSYGTISEFHTLKKPAVSIQAVTEISTTGATLNGNLTVAGYPSVTQHGFCMNIYGNPGFGDIVYDLGPKSSTGSFTQQLSGLELITTYYVKSFAINQADTVFSGEISFTTLALFTDINAGLTAVYYSSAAWGDYDNDGDLDIVLTGSTEGGSIVTKIYRNDSGNFSDISAVLSRLNYSTLSWGDYDNDGDLDILHAGGGGGIRINRNDLGYFTILSVGGDDGAEGSSLWGDLDNDGDLDILLSGASCLEDKVTKIYKNNGGIFEYHTTNLHGLVFGSNALGDFDNDGDLDILLTGQTGSDYEGTTENISRIYRNDAGIFTDINAGLPGVYGSSADWGDYDNDGDLDILLTGGQGGYAGISEIFRNDSGTFTDINAGLPELWGSEFAKWGDYDNDGDLDILLSGYTGAGYITEIFKNEGGGVFTDADAGLQVLNYGSTGSWGDYDNDGDLDILLTGWTGSEVISKIYRNNSIISNNRPSMPDSLSFQANAKGYTLGWNDSNDLQTPQSGLSYNIDLRVNGIIIKPGMADQTTGFRKIPAAGNVCHTLKHEIENSFCLPLLPQETKNVEVRVQAVDHALAGSEFAVLDTVFTAPDINISSKEIMVIEDELLWEYLYPDSVTSYEVQIDKDISFSDPITQIVPLGVGKLSGFDKSPYFHYALNQLTNLDSLENNLVYYWRMRPAYKNLGRAADFTKTPLSFTFNPIYYPPSPVSISVEGNYATISWAAGKEGEKCNIYNVYSSDNPYAEFPSGWTYQATVNSNEWVTSASALKKFYCITTVGSVKVK